MRRTRLWLICGALGLVFGGCKPEPGGTGSDPCMSTKLDGRCAGGMAGAIEDGGAGNGGGNDTGGSGGSRENTTGGTGGGSGGTSSCEPTTYYADVDGDGLGDATAPQSACAPPSGAVANTSDCNDEIYGCQRDCTECTSDGFL